MNHEYDLPDFDEASASQIPALLELVNLGYAYIARAAITEMRESTSQYVLRDVALKALRACAIQFLMKLFAVSRWESVYRFSITIFMNSIAVLTSAGHFPPSGRESIEQVYFLS